MRKMELAAGVAVYHFLHVLPEGGYRIDQDVLVRRPQQLHYFEQGRNAYIKWSSLKGVEEQYVEMPEDWPGADLRRS